MIALLLSLIVWFPSDSVWRHQASALPLDPRSAQWIADFFPLDKGFAINGDPRCGLPVNRTGPGWRRMTFTYAAESDTCLYPYSSSQPFESCNPDSHWAAVDTTSTTLFEVYGRHPTGESGAGAHWNLASNALRPIGWTSADEAGLPISPGLLNYDEAHAGSIRHALRFALSWPCVANAYVWPARHVATRAGLRPNGIPLGVRMRLRNDYSIPPNISPETAAILRCMRDYGLFLADRAGDSVGEFSLEASPDPRWGGILYELGARTKGISAYLEFVDESAFMADPNSGRWKSHWWHLW